MAPPSVFGVLHRFPTRGARSGHDAPDSKGDCGPESLLKQPVYVPPVMAILMVEHDEKWEDFWVPYVHLCSSMVMYFRRNPLFLGSDAVPLLFPG